jgi:hypothetical protein
MTPVTGPPPHVDRRRFLLGAVGAVGAAGAGLLAGCGGADPPRPVDDPVVTRPDRLEGDLAVAALLVSLENLLVSVYEDVLEPEARDKLELPPATVSLLETAVRQHKDHAGAWNGILTGAGKPGITGVNLTVKSMTSDPGLARLRDGAALLSLGQELETVVASTYLAAIGAIDNNAALKVAASIHPVESEHVATMAFLLGRTPAPEAFGRTDAGRPLTDSIG